MDEFRKISTIANSSPMDMVNFIFATRKIIKRQGKKSVPTNKIDMGTNQPDGETIIIVFLFETM